ncbi:odorant receptor Or2-like [Achroia grisella]|uniref:odorant receptor Or2-like n=1 Tax=Achroia grisella TaxID=688607 RepID=UPI0027D28DCC|nr:odorant receptor Or2-like [Achroia grisella]
MVSSNRPDCTTGLLKFLEDPRYPSVGPHLRFLGLIGLWRPKNSNFKRFKQFHFYVTILFFCSQYVKCLISMNSDSVMLILKYAPFHLGIAKSCYFRKDCKEWEKFIDFMSSIERKQLAKKDEEYEVILKEYIKRSRRVTYFFWGLAFFSNFSIFSEPYQYNQIVENGTSIYQHIFDGYTPFSWEPPGYYASMAIETVLGLTVSAYVITWDTLVVTMMIFFAGQLKITRLKCVQTIDLSSRSKSHENIVKCHIFYKDLIKYQKKFNSLISASMFIYLVVISVNLGVCIIQIAKIEDDLGTLISSCEFVLACLIQLLLFYWHANEVTEESKLVSYGTFESDWVDSDKKLQKEVALLGLTTTKIFVFKAGPFNVMSLATFISILRGSYSFFTLLSETN